MPRCREGKAMGETPVYLRARVRTRYPARITRLPWLAGPLVPLPISERMARRRDLNVLAWPGDRAGITARFEATPFSAELLELC